MSTYFTALYSLHKCLDAVLGLITVALRPASLDHPIFRGRDWSSCVGLELYSPGRFLCPCGQQMPVFKVQGWEGEGYSRVAIGSPLASLPPSHLL